MNINTILQLITVTIIGIIGYFIKDKVKSLQEKDKKNEESINSLQKELIDFQKEMPFRYVTRDEFIRSITNIDSKLDKIYEKLSQKGCDS